MWPTRHLNFFVLVFIFLLMPRVSWASNFFLDSEIQVAEKQVFTQGFSIGVNAGAAYYIKGVEALAEGTFQYRFYKTHALGAYVALVFPEIKCNVGLDYRFYLFDSFGGLSEDFLHLGFGMTYFEKLESKEFVPEVSLSYGKEVKIFPKAPFALRFSVGGSYLLGEPLARKQNPYSVQESHMVLYVKTGLIFF